MAKIAFHTLGCKVNQYETEAMMAQFESAGYSTVAFDETADVYLVNTCTVTNMADKKSRQMLAKAKKNNPYSLVVAVGCYVQAAQDTLEKVDNVDLLIGNTDKGRVVEVIENYLDESLTPEIADLSKYHLYDEMWVSLKQGHTRAHIKIQDGCDQFCSYCIIPYARGRIRSRQSDSILAEVKELVRHDYREVVLTGIHLASYGKQFENYALIDLLEELETVDGLVRVRLGSLEPTLITDDFANRLSKLTKICDHFHLSLQSGNDAVLKRMNRKYTTSDYLESVKKLRNYFPYAAITTDLIVGFPGETEFEFDETLDFLREVDFADVHVFKYSMRDGTQAAKMSSQVDGTVKNHRSQVAMTLAFDMRKKFMKRMIGHKANFLIEEKETFNNVAYYTGHTTNYIKVYMRVTEELVKGSSAECEIAALFEDGIGTI